MKTILDILKEKVSQALAKAGYDAAYGIVTISDRPDLGQFQCNGAYAAAKKYRKSPMIIAKEVAPLIEGCEVSVVGGFININVTDAFLLEYMKLVLEDPHLGIQQTAKQETVFLDYGGPNAAKALHVGHLRSAIIGESLKRLAQATGRTTVGDVHLGDWGLQMGLVMAEIEERGESEVSKDNWDTIYPYASQKSKEDPVFKEKAQTITALLQKGDPKYTALWKQLMGISIEYIKENYRLLDVHFDLWHGESDSEQYVPELLRELSDQKLLTESQGAQVVEIEEAEDAAPMPPVIIKKSNGASGYATTDLATIIEREKLCHPDAIWYIVDARQSLHFAQVFRCAKKAGLVPEATVLEHLPFGTMNGKDGKPYKTRDGGVMRLIDFYNEVYAAVCKRTHSEDPSVAHKITVAAIKFGDMINHRSKNYIFDIEKFTAFEGKTGVFLLYTIARIHSILRKVEVDAAGTGDTIYSEAERALLLTLSLSNAVFEQAYQEKAPNYICENAYKIAQAFSKFYSESHIVRETDTVKQAAWVKLCIATKKILEKHLEILGIEPVEEM